MAFYGTQVHLVEPVKLENVTTSNLTEGKNERFGRAILRLRGREFAASSSLKLYLI
jgi:hypothetical protein